MEEKEKDWGTRALESALEKVKNMSVDDYEKLLASIKDKEPKGTIQEQIKQVAARRNCYCGLWEKDPEFMRDEKGYNPGFCGKCEICGKDGHLSHFPGPMPYTGSWCDYHYYVMYRLGRRMNRGWRVVTD